MNGTPDDRPAEPDPPEDILLCLRPLRRDVPVEVRLRKLVKAALRAYGFRLLSITGVSPPRGPAAGMPEAEGGATAIS